jgi:hypothetical protein
VLTGIGEDLARATARSPRRPVVPTQDESTVVGKLLAAVGLEKVLKDRLEPVYLRHYQRVMRDTLKTIKLEVGLETDMPDEAARRILREGGKRMGLLDIEKQAKEAIFRALADGRANGDNPVEIARRIRAVRARRPLHEGRLRLPRAADRARRDRARAARLVARLLPRGPERDRRDPARRPARTRTPSAPRATATASPSPRPSR